MDSGPGPGPRPTAPSASSYHSPDWWNPLVRWPPPSLTMLPREAVPIGLFAENKDVDDVVVDDVVVDEDEDTT